MRSTDVLACNYINRDTVSARQARRSECRVSRFFGAYLWFCQLSRLFKHTQRERASEQESEHEAGALSVHGERITGELQRERLSLTEQVQGRPRCVAIKRQMDRSRRVLNKD